MQRRVVNLNGSDWKLGQAVREDDPHSPSWHELGSIRSWIPAEVPGNVRADLARAGRLHDLYFGMQSLDAQWVDDHCWWLVRQVDLSIAPSERVHLVVYGVDYISDLFFNGHHLGRHEGMFSKQIYEITGLLLRESQLAVRILGSAWLPTDRSSRWERVLNRVEAMASGLSSCFPHRRDTVKCQMGFGWDFAPALRTMGIWDDVVAIVSGGVFIRDVSATPRCTGDVAVLNIVAELDSDADRRLSIRCTLQGETFDSQAVVVEHTADLPAGISRHAINLAVRSPRLWWPWDHGRPDLYRLTVEVRDGDRALDSASDCTGLRQIEFEDWTLRLNGQRVYVRGANWVPANILPGRVQASDVRSLLHLARRANMNMLRVWGGGLREKRSFYDLCDRLGILLWQEFPFACTYLTRHPRSANYLTQVGKEVRAIIRELRNHPSVTIWCGGNEFVPERNRPLVSSLLGALAEEDPSRPFLPASPSQGDSHNWHVWHSFYPPSAYRRDQAPFASELGLQAAPGTASLRQFIPSEHLWPPGPSWSHHGAELRKLWRYARPFLSEHGVTLDSFVTASQRAQAHALQIAIEHFRRRKARGNGGILVWQFNEPWPAISWSLVDFYGQGKLAFDVVGRLYNPVLVSLDYALGRYEPGHALEASVWVINDTAQDLFDCWLEVELFDREGQSADLHTMKLMVQADSAKSYGQISWTLPPGGGWWLGCRLVQSEAVLTANEYDLSFCDDIGPNVAQRLRNWLKGALTPRS